MRLAAPRPMTAAVLVVLASTSAGAQTPALPRTPDGKPNLQGIWQVLNTAAWDLQDHSARLGVPGGQAVVDGNDIPYQPATLKQKQQNFANRATADPETKGFLPGVPRIMYMPLPFQIFQTPTHVAMTFEYAQAVRIIYTNGTPHPRGPINWWLGDSRGTLGRRHARRRRRALHGPDVAGSRRQLPQRRAASGRALHDDGPGSHQLRGDGRRPEGIHQAMEDEHAALSPQGAECPAARLPAGAADGARKQAARERDKTE